MTITLGIMMADEDFDKNWRIGFEMFFLKQGKRLSNLKDFTSQN